MVSNFARRMVIRTYKFRTAIKKLTSLTHFRLSEPPRHPFADPSLRRTAVLYGMIELSVNNELERVWKDAIAASFEILPARLPLG